MRKLSARCFAKSMPGSRTIASRGNTDPFGKRDLRGEEIFEAAHDVIVADVRVRDLRLADRVHDEQRRSRVRAETGILVGGQAADVVEQIATRGAAPAG